MAFQSDSIFWVEVEKIVPNPYQPRREFDESKLRELSDSIRMYGILQPLTVTRKEVVRDDGAFYSEYELIAGERRLRASKLAGLLQVPVIIREGEQNEQEKLELAIIENLQREDLNAVDRALAFKQLSEVFSLSHVKIAKKVGRSREYVSNTLRLLLLPDHMLSSLRVADISEGHARALLMLNDKPEELETLYREILLKKLSVREVERITRKIANDKVRSRKWKDIDPELIEYEKKFTETLGTRVQILKTDFGGKLTIDYFAENDLNKLLEMLNQNNGEASVQSNAFTAPSEVKTETENSEMIDSLSEHTALQGVTKPEERSTDYEVPGEEKKEEQLEHSVDTEHVPYTPEAERNINETPRNPEHISQTPEPEETQNIMETPAEERSVEKSEYTPHATDAEEVTTPSTESSEHKKPEEEDDSGLYAIKNFGV
ncbi:MAG: ParB/RepB/Spo0J family partition protein [Candidatus Paceibacterota bacterium]